MEAVECRNLSGRELWRCEIAMADHSKDKETRSKRRIDPHLGKTNPSDKVKMTVTLPRSVAAFLRWKAEVEGITRDELLRRVVIHYAQKLRERQFETPPIFDLGAAKK